MWSRWWAYFGWAELTWILLSFTASVEQIVVGIAVSAAVAWACIPLGSIAGPWWLLRPRRWRPLLALAAVMAWRIVQANLELTRRIWAAHPPSSGMLVVETETRTDGEVTAVGLLTSVIVNSQLVDLDRRRNTLQYHAVTVSSLDPDANRAEINGPVEDRVLAVTRR